MGYASNSQSVSQKHSFKYLHDSKLSTTGKTPCKLNRRIAKKTKRFQQQHKSRQCERQYNLKQNNHIKWRPYTRLHCGYRRYSQRQFIPFSPEYKPSSPAIVIKPFSYSDQYKPEALQQASQMESYDSYIDGLLLLKMQREEQRSQELIERLGRISFGEGDPKGQV